MDIKDIVKNNVVDFVKFRQGIAYYRVGVPGCGDYMFPVPVDDLGEATILAKDKAIMFMRHIRKAKEEGTFVRAE